MGIKGQKENVSTKERRNPTIRIRPFPDYVMGNDIKIEEKVIFQPIRQESAEKVIQALENASYDQLNILVDEIRTDPAVIDKVLHHFLNIIADTKSRWDWEEGTIDEDHRIYPKANRGSRAADVLSIIGDPAIPYLLQNLEEAGRKLESDFTNEIVITLIAEALQKSKTQKSEVVAALIKVLGIFEQYSSDKAHQYFNCRQIRIVLQNIFRDNPGVYSLETYQDWKNWWQKTNNGLNN